MLNKLYRILVLTNETIRRKYEYYKFTHPSLHRKCRLLSWIYLACLLLRYGLTRRHVKIPFPESAFSRQISLEEYEKLARKAQILSFDIFDTLLLRRVNYPVDVFSLMSAKTGIVDFKSLRIEAEGRAREKAENHEVTIQDIYAEMLDFSPEERASLIELEFETECAVCYPNPHVKTFFEYARSTGKKVIAVSDNYWQAARLEALLARCGYTGFDKVYVSCDYSRSKHDGALQRVAFEDQGGASVLHIGDAGGADDRSFRGWKSVIYKNVTTEGFPFRQWLPSACGGVYCAEMNAALHNGEEARGGAYEFGYVYGGFLSYGYCQFIDRIVKDDKDAVILFTARDSEVFYEIYKRYFGRCDSAYVYCSRASMLKANLPVGGELFYDVMFRSKSRLEHKITIGEAFRHAGIRLSEELFALYDFTADDLLSAETLDKVRALLSEHLDDVVSGYADLRAAATEYLRSVIGKHKKVYIVDLGWRGTVYYLMRRLIREIDPDLHVEGFFFGSFESDMAISLIESDEMHSYAFAHDFNRYTMPLETIMIVETLFSTSVPSTKGYGRDEKGNAIPLFASESAPDPVAERIYGGLREGMYAFCEKYDALLRSLGVRSVIPGAEAVAPISHVCRNYDYILDVFGELKISELAGEKDMPFREVMSRLGYK